MLLPDNALSIYKGSSKTILVDVVDENAVPIDLTGARIVFTVRDSMDGRDSLILKTSDNPSQVEVVQPPRLGQVKIFLAPQDTATLNTLEQYVYDVWVLLPTGTRYPVIPPSTFEVLGTVTRLP